MKIPGLGFRRSFESENEERRHHHSISGNGHRPRILARYLDEFPKLNSRAGVFGGSSSGPAMGKWRLN